jgi:hypothetical protein
MKASVKANIEEPPTFQGEETFASPPWKGEGPGEVSEGTRPVTVLYSRHRDVYKLPSCGKDLWLSVEVYLLSDFGRAGGSSVGAAQTADGRAWRRLYRNWSIIVPGQTTAIPADDPLVVDYMRQVEAERL